MLFAMRSSPGSAALAGFCVGLIADSLTPARFGAAALAHTVVGYLGLVGAGGLLRRQPAGERRLRRRRRLAARLHRAGRERRRDRSFLTELALYSPLQALTSALFALIVLLGVPRVVLDPARRVRPAA